MTQPSVPASLVWSEDHLAILTTSLVRGFLGTAVGITGDYLRMRELADESTSRRAGVVSLHRAFGGFFHLFDGWFDFDLPAASAVLGLLRSGVYSIAAHTFSGQTVFPEYQEPLLALLGAWAEQQRSYRVEEVLKQHPLKVSLVDVFVAGPFDDNSCTKTAVEAGCRQIVRNVIEHYLVRDDQRVNPVHRTPDMFLLTPVDTLRLPTSDRICVRPSVT